MRVVIRWLELYAKYDDGTESVEPLVAVPFPWVVRG